MAMGKTVMTLVIPEPKVRKPQPKAAQKHKDKTKYTRKVKHKAPEWGPFHADGVIFYRGCTVALHATHQDAVPSRQAA